MFDKQELRKRFFKIRDLIEDREYKEQKICNLLTSLNLKTNSVISGYYPIKNEVNILPFLKFLNKKEVIICLPSIEKKNSHLLFKKWEFGDRLIKGKFMINEPDHNEFIEPSVLLVPRLAFDKNKNRLGYGGGFYDRTI